MNPDSLRSFHFYLYGTDRGHIESSFEDSARRLEELEKLYFEPDGSFVWARNGGEEKVYGMVYDTGQYVQYCDMRGKCRQSTLRTLCEAILGSRDIDRLQLLHLIESRWQDFQSFEESF